MKKGIVFLLLLFSAVVYWQWFFTDWTYTWGDWGWYFNETIRRWFGVPQIWLYSASGGTDISLTQYFSTKFLYSLLSFITRPPWIDRFVFFIPSVVFPVISGYYLGKKLFRNIPAAVFCSLVFFLNAYAINLRTGHFTLAVAFGLAPLVILFFIRTLEYALLRDALITGLLSWLCFSYEPRSFLIIGCTLGAYFVYYNILNTPHSFSQFCKRVGLAATPLVILVLTSLYAIIGIKISSGIITSQILNRSLFGSGYVNIQRGLTLSTHAWTENLNTRPDILYIMPYFWVIPIIAFLGLWVGRKDKNVLFFGMIALIGVFLVKQSNQPFDRVYELLFRYIPGFSVFREPSKFYFLIGLGYSVLIASLVRYLATSDKKYKWITLTVLSLPFLTNALPLIQGQVGKLQTPRVIPDDYLVYHDFIKAHPGDYRTMFVPVDSRWGYWDDRIRKMNAVNYAVYEWPQLADYKKEGLEYSSIDQVMSIFEKDFSSRLLSRYSVKYVVIPVDDIANEDIFIYSWGARSEYIKRVSELKYLHPVSLPASQLLVYENPTFRPLLYWTLKPETLLEDQPYGKIDFNRISQTQFQLLLSRVPVTPSITISFGEKYDSDWKLRVGDFSWYRSLVEKNYWLSGSTHIQSDIGTNEISFNANELIALHPESVVARHSDGTADLQLHLYYAPQAYVNIGTIISIISVTVLLAGVAYLTVNNHENT